MIRELANGREVEYRGSTLRFPWADQEQGRGLGGRVRAEGARADRRGRRRVHPAARRSRHRGVDDRRGAAQPPRPPAATPARSRSAWRRLRTSRTTSRHARDQCRWFGGMVGNHVADIVARYGEDLGGPGGADRLHQGSRGLRLQRARTGGEHPHGLRARRYRRPLLHPRPGGGARAAARGAAGARAWTSSPSTCSTTPRTRRCEAYGEKVIPAIAESVLATS